MVVAVVSLEPLRLAAENLGGDLKDVVGVMGCVGRLWRREVRRRGGEEDSLDWCLGGHSFGGYTALRLAPQLHRYIEDNRGPRHSLNSKNDGEGEGGVEHRLQVVAWAVGLEYITDLSKNVDIDILVVNGSNDNMVSLKTKEVQMELRSKLPSTPRTKCVIISGGSHNYFASYSSPKKIMKLFMKLNGIPGVSRDRQHEMVCNETLRFLFSR